MNIQLRAAFLVQFKRNHIVSGPGARSKARIDAGRARAIGPSNIVMMNQAHFFWWQQFADNTSYFYFYLVIKAEDDYYPSSDSPLRKLLFDKIGRPKKRVNARRSGDEERSVSGVFPIERYLNSVPDANTPHFSRQYNTPDNFRLGIEAKDLAEALASDAVKSFSRTYNTPDTFRLGVETKDLNSEDAYDVNDRFLSDVRENVYSSPVERQLAYDAYRNGAADSGDMEDAIVYENQERTRNAVRPLATFRGNEDRLSHDLEVLADDAGREMQSGGRVFTEGGVVSLADDQTGNDISLFLASTYYASTEGSPKG